MNKITLYGSPLSLYTGRARSYLIKAGLEYQETTPTSRHYRDVVVPKAGGRQGVPTIETAAGEVIRDGAAIIDHYEATAGKPFSPTTPRQRVLSRLFDVIGTEGLLRPAMHYRWNFPESNLNFLNFHFQSMMPPGPQRVEKAAAAADRMRAACMGFGAVPDTFELVESLYLELMQKLDQHFADQPYLLGGRPCIGDFGMIAPLYGHLGRDPKPLSLMQTHSIRLFRWVERMNRPDSDVGEFEIQDEQYLADDQIPESLIEVLKHIAIDFVPETQAAANCINEWIDQQEDLSPGTPASRGVGMAPFDVRGVTINALAQPYRFYLLKRVQDEYAQMSKPEQSQVAELLSSCGMSKLLDIRLTREIGRDNNLEVWL
jgi:glutathione S-transferase